MTMIRVTCMNILNVLVYRVRGCWVSIISAVMVMTSFRSSGPAAWAVVVLSFKV